MNDILFDFLEKFCSVYLDDILIYSDNLKEHKQQVRQVLERLRRAELQVNIRKSEFHVHETLFLGVIIGANGIKMNLEKIRVIFEWAVSRTVKQIQSFLDFCNFYRRFIEGFAKLADPLTQLSKKDRLFDWNEACQLAFEGLKKRVTSAPVLQHFDHTQKTYLKTDFSDYVIGGILSQMGKNDQLHPVAFYSHKMLPAECNYEIYDKELLAIIKCFEQWRPELESSTIPVQIFTDHRALEYFNTKHTLTRRQARWAEKLSEFNFVIQYREGKTNQKADALTRQSNSGPFSSDDDRVKHQEQVLLGPDRLILAANDIENFTIHEVIRAAIITDEKAQNIIQKINDNEDTVRTDRDKLHLTDAKVVESLMLIKNRI